MRCPPWRIFVIDCCSHRVSVEACSRLFLLAVLLLAVSVGLVMDKPTLLSLRKVVDWLIVRVDLSADGVLFRKILE